MPFMFCTLALLYAKGHLGIGRQGAGISSLACWVDWAHHDLVANLEGAVEIGTIRA